MYALNKFDFSASIVNSLDATISTKINVIGANDTLKTITFMYGGAWSGQYNVIIRHS